MTTANLIDVLNDGDVNQSRRARMAGEQRAAEVERYRQDVRQTPKQGYGGMQWIIRPQRPFKVGAGRSAHFDTLFAFYIDLVRDPSRAREKDPEVHNRMRQDLQVLGCLNVRKLATLHLNREWKPAASDNPEAQRVARRFERLFEQQYRITETLSNFLDAILDGISIQEIVWGLNEDDFSFGIDRMFPCFKDRFVFSKDGKLALLTRQNVFYGEIVHPWQFIKHVFNPSGGAWAVPQDEGRIYWGQGLEDNIYPNYFFKTVVLNFYTRWLQRLSSGVLIGRYPANNPEAKSKAMELLQAYQEDEELAYPSGNEWEIEIKEATRAPADTYLTFIDYIDRQVSKAILGSTLIIDQGDVGTQSLGEVHERTTFGRITEFDRLGLVETINREVVPVIGQLNHIPQPLWPTFDMPLDETTPAVAGVLEAFMLLQTMGFDISAEMVSEKTGFRQPKPNERILTMPMQMMAGGMGEMGDLQGPGAPPAGRFNLTSPEGLTRFRSLIHRAAHNHVRGREKYQLAVGGLDRPHRHVAVLDRDGNGQTDQGFDGHYHEVRSFKCVPTDGHGHDVLIPHDQMDRVIRMLAEN